MTRPPRRSGEGWRVVVVVVVLVVVGVAGAWVSSRLYLLYNHWLPQLLLYVFIVLDLSLAIFEEPAVVPLPAWVRAPGG